MEHREAFYKAIAEKRNKNYNTVSLTREKYAEIISRIDFLQENPHIKKYRKDYRILKKYTVLTISVNDIHVRKLFKKGTSLRFVSVDEVYDEIHSIHRLRGHAGRNIVMKELDTKFANITGEEVQIYINMCANWINMSPYEAYNGRKPSMGISATNLPKEILKLLETEEQLSGALHVNTDDLDENNFSANEDYDRNLEDIWQYEDEEAEFEKRFDVQDESKSALVCVSCSKQTSGAHICRKCSKPCHAIAPCSVPEFENNNEGYGVAVLCQLCSRTTNIYAARSKAKRSQEMQAQRMLRNSAKRFKPIAVGKTVMVPVPEVDRGRTDFRNITAVVMEVDEHAMYKLGTTSGILKQRYTRTQFMSCPAQFLQAEDVPNNEVSLREVANANSLGSGQGFFKCNCLKNVKFVQRALQVIAGNHFLNDPNDETFIESITKT
ncbi:uncharacterized protein TRIADDRAFT_62470 [Trichoplax adhaerens]|uniref:SCAN domain-containing protein n=1 Tax=Trichoplax adhaerens TaxID=10228 RepID=B3SDW5_TRIAD|nr:predicted protein [Trichoplax adhaerens]EDV19080.1 predicted protein [Trichoplax adhaerens]|eukprot:XP_002118434.1 predicted protein [Trichoplax adhaerens]